MLVNTGALKHRDPCNKSSKNRESDALLKNRARLRRPEAPK